MEQEEADVTPVLKLEKSRSGIRGLDELTEGGLPKGRPTLVCGGPGSGKTLFAMEFLVRGVLEYDEPGVFVTFEEAPDELARNVASLGFDLPSLEAQGRIVVDHVRIDRSEIEDTGEFDLEGLFIRLGYAIDSVGARRVVLDTLESIFAALPNEFIVRSELQRLFRWLKERGVTVVITGERGDGQLTRQGLEEYVSDCVILLDHRVVDQISTRRLRIVKYRGTAHGTNEYPFLIDRDGFWVLPITGFGLEHAVSDERVSTGVAKLDALLGGGGVYRGSTVLASGPAGTGKTSISAQFTEAACRRGERVLYYAFEESFQQLARNMRSIGVDLAPHAAAGLLRHVASRPTSHGLETHLALMIRELNTFAPHHVIVDPITNLVNIGSPREIEAMLMRLVDSLKVRGITAIFTSLTSDSAYLEDTNVGISSLIDTWLLLRNVESKGERNRAIYVLKSRGMSHSNQVREFRMTDKGVDLVDVYMGPDGVLLGSARAEEEQRLASAAVDHARHQARKRAEFDRRRRAVTAQIAALQAELASEAELLSCEESDGASQLNGASASRRDLAAHRQGRDARAGSDHG
jgi:circadian clock protein KaiC